VAGRVSSARFVGRAPQLAQLRDAYDAAARGDLAQAVAEARAARRLNPASIDPLLAWAAAEGAEGHVAKADRLYARAISIQPGNWRGWYERAQFEASVNDLPAALADAQRATALDSFGLPRPYAVTLSAEYQAQLQKQQQQKQQLQKQQQQKQKQQAKKPTKP
jgi:hypothetical protein